MQKMPSRSRARAVAAIFHAAAAAGRVVVGFAAVVGSMSALTLATGCSATRSSDPVALTSLYPDHAVKPEGVIVEQKKKLGPPPPGHPKIVGEPVPNWTWESQFERSSYPLNWTFVGPSAIPSEYWSGNTKASGRVISIAPHPTDPNTCYAASASGGLWKTTNGGTSWFPLTDQLSILNSGYVVVDPVNHERVYYGTGEYWTSSNGDGLFRSDDGGATWTQLANASQVGTRITGIAINPNNTAIIHLTSNAGTYISFNSGSTWSQRLSGACPSLALDPINPNNVLVGRHGQGVYKSIDGGLTYTKLGGGLPTTSIGMVLVDLCRSSPDDMYTAIVGSGGSVNGVFRSTDGGATWVKKTATPNFCSPQCWYDIYLAVDPNDPEVVYLGGVDPRYAVAGVLKSVNGGNSWTEISQFSGGTLHPDHHTLVFGPGNTIWEGNDGGVWKSTNGGASWINCNNGLGTAQLYTIALHPAFPDRMLGGTQDNGTPERVSASTEWPQLQAGDGGFSAFDYSSSTRRYTTYVYLSIYRWTNSSSRNITGPWGSDSTNWISPLVIDPVTPSTLYAGTNRVWRTTNATVTTPSWTAISTNSVANGGTLNTIAVAPSNNSVIYTGSSNGRISYTSNLSTWSTRSTGLPTSGVSDIIINPSNAAEAFASFYSSTGGRIFRTVDSGLTWTAVGSNLPSGVVPRALEVDFAFDPRAIYAGAGAGIYHSLDGGATWMKNNATFPNANVGDIAIDRDRRRIVVATYGRGAWMSNLPSPCPADYNGDTVQDVVDFLDFLDDFGACEQQPAPCGTNSNADYNGDTIIDILDFLDFIDAFGQGCP
ncbi:MAG: hypothetical protein KIT19_08365 [Phycisphaeraceae bacterium]|nr:hypothetical protein [Phycisphaeraceae bacterium]